MTFRRVIIYTCLLFLIINIGSGLLKAATRDLYIGDVLEIKITTSQYSPDQIKEKLKEFEVVDLKKSDNGYLIKIRSFETGVKKIRLGSKLLKIDVKSTLTKYDRDQVFAGDLKVEQINEFKLYRYLFYGLVVLLVMIVLGFVWKLYRNKNSDKQLSPFVKFKRKLESVDKNGAEFFVVLTYAFKKYIEESFNRRIIGKTSSEIMEEINDITQLNSYLKRIKDWLETADYYKFTTGEADKKQRKQQLQKLKKIVKEIDSVSESELENEAEAESESEAKAEAEDENSEKKKSENANET